MTTPTHVDVLIVGAGLSGIGAAVHLTTAFPGRSYAILEKRGASGGTWDLFRYPGVRSDSDMYTLGYRFKPWVGDKALADGPSILDYVRETAREHGIDQQIRYRHRVLGADWDSEAALWTVTVDHQGEVIELTCRFLWSCSGYYDYEQGYSPPFPGRERFTGQVVHPQHWPEDLDYAGRKVVVIGSGATAVTLVPAMAGTAEHVTMLQRSPTYVLSLPGRDPIALGLRKVLPGTLAYRLVRAKNVAMQSASYRACRAFPGVARRVIRTAAARSLPDDYEVDVHFKPRYDPWDERLCVVPDGDLFKALRRGSAEIVTDTIDTFTESGIRLASGRELEADIIVTATGLNLSIFGAATLSVDGAEVKLPETMAFRAMMLSGVPNFAFTIGYTNASWTLKADLVAEYVVRLLRHLDETGTRSVVPVRDADVSEAPFMDFEPGYVRRAIDRLPKAGDREPWRLRQSYLHDVRTIRRGEIADAALRFS
ncbi:NAD(P)/FAD-dependent oxidoreductase [Nocardioides sp.]|uniref:flavin-containing monooxygenase n=1 Tax=Nocardioides sp. TaxID=35761 RepID=UPI002736A04F|nr:NAD(P)/FAD-dependent oxidoreductase [Nocardioides sp.]MDP3893463.1 NAD(P)/FAD-dependent oxidoreductase [Nocardioides sp.]